jgi:hypothetical protein
MDLSCDLGNASHYDCFDASYGFSVWVEETPSLARNWKFVLPNIHCFWDDAIYDGVVINLFHGASISWDG